MQYFSQAGQDKWVCETLDFKKGGFFVEIGAYDGIQTSNTYVLEKSLGWGGICIEANPSAFSKLQKNRSSINTSVAVSTYKGFCGFGSDSIISNQGTTPCDTLSNILLDCGAPNYIDYISLDVEGLEWDILNTFDFNKWKVNLWTIEHNLYCRGAEQKEKIYKTMVLNGFERVVEDVLADGRLAFEDWYKKIE